MTAPLHVRRLGTVDYESALAAQRTLHHRRGESWLLLVEHPHVFTLGVRAHLQHVLVDPATVGATLVRADRGGDVTYHGPGQVVGYPIVEVPFGPGAVPGHVHSVEQVVIDGLADCGLPGTSRRQGFPGVWIGTEKVAAVGVRITRGRSMHGFAVNVDPDLGMFGHIVPCGIRDGGVTSLCAQGVAASVRDVEDAIAARAAAHWGDGELDDRDAAVAELLRGAADGDVREASDVRHLHASQP